MQKMSFGLHGHPHWHLPCTRPKTNMVSVWLPLTNLNAVQASGFTPFIPNSLWGSLTLSSLDSLNMQGHPIHAGALTTPRLQYS